MSITIPARCTTKTVNAALAEAGYPAYIYCDPYNGHNYGVSWSQDGCDYYQPTSFSTARAIAQAFADDLLHI